MIQPWFVATTGLRLIAVVIDAALVVFVLGVDVIIFVEWKVVHIYSFGLDFGERFKLSSCL
jgi:hypothetical protein